MSALRALARYAVYRVLRGGRAAVRSAPPRLAMLSEDTCEKQRWAMRLPCISLLLLGQLRLVRHLPEQVAPLLLPLVSLSGP